MQEYHNIQLSTVRAELEFVVDTVVGCVCLAESFYKGFPTMFFYYTVFLDYNISTTVV